MILIRRRVVIVVALSIMIFTATASVLSGLSSAPSAFAADSRFVISETSAPTIFSSHVSLDMVSALRSIPNITGVSPEIFAFSNWNGASFVVRGIGQGFGPGALNLSSGNALVGHRLLGKLGVALPCQLPLVGSFSSRMTVVNVVGSVDTGTALDDELLVPMDVARFLSGMPSGEASVLLVSTTSPGWLKEMLSPEKARFALFDLRSSRTEMALGQPLELTVSVRNWGASPGSVRVMFADNGSVLGQRIVTLNASASTVLQESFGLAGLGRHSIKASVSGDFPVELFANVTVVAPYLQISAPSRVMLGSEFNVTVIRYDGSAAAGASVQFDNQSAICSIDGRATFHGPHAGSFALLASLAGYTNASAAVEVVDPAAYSQVFQPSIVSFSISPESMKESETAHGLVTVQNGGALPGSVLIQVLVDSKTYETLNISLGGMSSGTVAFGIDGLQPGAHTVQVGSFSVGLSVEPWYTGNPGLVQLVIRYGGSMSLSSSASVPVYQAAKISEGNISVALFSIGAVSVLLAALAIISVFSKEIRQSRTKLGVLKAIGAPRTAIGSIVFPQALATGLVGALAGIVLGVLTAEGLSRWSAFSLFGHELNLAVDPGLLAVVLLAAVAISIASALASTLAAVRETAIRSIRSLEEEAAEPVDVDQLLGEE